MYRCFFRSFLFVVRVSSSSHLLAGPSCFSLISRRYDKSQIPLGDFSRPSVWALGGDPQGLSPFSFFCVSTQFVMLCFSICSSTSLNVLNPIFLFIFFARTNRNEGSLEPMKMVMTPQCAPKESGGLRCRPQCPSMCHTSTLSPRAPV